MNKSLSITSIVTAGVLVMAGCSGSPEAAIPQQTFRSVSQAAVGADSALVGSAAGVAAVGGSNSAVSTTSGPGAVDAAAVGSAPVGSTGTADAGVRLITASAIGTVTGTPDVVTVVLGVKTTSPSARTALDDNNRLATDVIKVIKDKGVAPEDLQTSQLSIYPSYDDRGTVSGYQVANMVTAKLRDIAGAGALIDAAGQAAGDAVRVQQLSFSIDDDSALRADARADAVRRAQAQAKQMADAAGITLGAIHSITESSTANPSFYPQAAMSAETSAGAAPIQAGSQELTVSVQVVYEIA